MIEAPDVKPWLFLIKPYEGESLSHFLGRFRRANHLSASGLGTLAGIGAIVARWERFHFNPRPSQQELEAIASVVEVDAQRLAQMLPPAGVGMQHEPIRLCGACYAESPLQQVKTLHDWLDGKRKARKSCRVVGESRTGKTVACDAYRYRHKIQQEAGRPPTVPVVYIRPHQKCGPKDLFKKITEYLKYRVTKGTVSDFRDRTIEVLKGCGVEMLIIDEADRLKPETFADVRDIAEDLGIAVVLVGTDRLDAVIKRDEQVLERFRAHLRFGKLSGEDFKNTVEMWEQMVLKLPVSSNLKSKEMLRILTSATEGYIGRLDEILREAAIRSLSRGLKKIDKAVLQEVAKEYK